MFGTQITVTLQAMTSMNGATKRCLVFKCDFIQWVHSHRTNMPHKDDPTWYWSSESKEVVLIVYFSTIHHIDTASDWTRTSWLKNNCLPRNNLLYNWQIIMLIFCIWNWHQICHKHNKTAWEREVLLGFSQLEVIRFTSPTQRAKCDQREKCGKIYHNWRWSDLPLLPKEQSVTKERSVVKSITAGGDQNYLSYPKSKV